MVAEAIEIAHDHKPSMLQDVLARRRTEVDVLNGGVAAQGRLAGVPTPRHDAMVALVHGLERSWEEQPMKLVTFDDGRVGYLDDQTVVELDCRRRGSSSSGAASAPDPRDGGAARAGRRTAARADRAEEVLPHRRQLRRAPRGAAGRRLVAPGAQGDRVLPERRRDHRAGRRHRVPRGADQGARLRARAGGRDRHGPGKFFGRGRGRVVHRRLHRLQRHHRSRHPAPRDGVGGVLVLEGDRHLLPDRAVDRHRRRDRRTRTRWRWSCG